MARYELGTIYKINGKENIYFARLLTQDTYGIFEPIYGEICQENFLKTGYRLYITTGTFAVKRGFWGKILPSPDKSDYERWRRPAHLVNFAPWDIEGSLERCSSIDINGFTEILNEKEYIEHLKHGFISNIFPMYEKIASFLDRNYEN